jgi:hypothetical protein
MRGDVSYRASKNARGRERHFVGGISVAVVGALCEIQRQEGGDRARLFDLVDVAEFVGQQLWNGVAAQDIYSVSERQSVDAEADEILLER